VLSDTERSWAGELQQRDAVIREKQAWPVYIDVSAKAENTKDETRTRETFSAPANFRELMSELDHAAVAVCADRPTVYVRRVEKYNDKTISDMVALSSPRNSGKALIISIDITKFSPKMNRDFMLSHHDIMLSMTTAPKGYTFKKLWRNLCVGINKRDTRYCFKSETGDFQGWAGTSNSLLHANLIEYSIKRLKTKGIISRFTLVLPAANIDDAAFVFQFPMGTTNQEAADVARVLYDELVEIYMELRFEIAIAKTVVATNKGTFLNIDFIDGVVVPLPTKTAMRLFWSVDKRFADTPDLIEELFNTARGAIAKGACPVTVYSLGVFQALRHTFRYCPKTKDLTPVELAISCFATRASGGWGIPSLSQVLSKEGTDPLTSCVILARSFAQLAQRPDGSIALERVATAMAVFSALFPSNFERVSFWAAVGAPRSIHVRGIVDPQAIVKRAAEVTLRRIGPCKEIATVLNCEPNRMQEAHLWNLAGGLTLDLAVLEALGEVRPLKAYMDIVKKCLSSDALHRIMPGHIVRGVRAKVRAASRSNMVQPAKRYRAYKWEDADMHTVSQLLHEFPGAVCSDYYDRWFNFLGLSVVNCADPDPRLVVCVWILETRQSCP
jgi:hypothetical protein